MRACAGTSWLVPLLLVLSYTRGASLTSGLLVTLRAFGPAAPLPTTTGPIPPPAFRQVSPRIGLRALTVTAYSNLFSQRGA